MIFLVQSSLSHSMVLFFSSLSLFVGWLSEGKKNTQSCFQVLKTQGQDEHEGRKSDWRRSQCHTYHTPSHAWQGEAFTVATAVACLLSECVQLPSEPGSDTDGGSAPPLPIWVKTTIAMTEKSAPAFQGITLQFALQPEFIRTSLACTKPTLNSSGGKMSSLIDS